MASDLPRDAGERPGPAAPLLYRGAFVLGVGVLFVAFGAGLFQALRETSRPPYGSLAYLQAADRAYEEGDAERALLEYDKSFRINPRDLRAGTRRVDLLQRAGRSEEALEALQRMAARTGDVPTRVRLALALGSAGREEEARAVLEQVVSSEPRAVMARIYLGDLLAARGETAEASRLYREVLAIDPSQAQAGLRIRALERREGAGR